MFFNINKKLFSDGLNIVSKAVSLNSPLPVYHNIKLSVKDDYIQLTASDGDISIETIINKENDNLSINSTGDILLDGRYFSDMIRKVDSDTVDVEIIDGNLCSIRGSAVSFEITGVNAQEFPLIQFNKPDNFFSMNVNTLKDIILQTCFACSDKETKAILTGVNFSCVDNILTTVATDSYRLAQKVIYLDKSNNFNVTIPAKNLLDISKIMPSDGKVDIYVDDKKALFVFDNVLVQTRLIEGNYPQTSRLIPTSFISELTVDARDFLSALERASFIKNEGVNIVRLQLTEDNILLTCKSNEIISQEVIVPTSFTGEAIDISFKGNYVYDAIRALNTYEVKINLCGSMKPFTLVSTNSDQLLQLVLPIKTYN